MHDHVYLLVPKALHNTAALPRHKLRERVWHWLLGIIKQQVAVIYAGEQKVASQEYKNESENKTIFTK